MVIYSTILKPTNLVYNLLDLVLNFINVYSISLAIELLHDKL
jgi:hypothetical protein